MSQSVPTPASAASLAPASTGQTDEPPLYVNRERSWLEFNRRVLHEALDERTPLLERVGFLAKANSGHSGSESASAA